MQNLYGQRQRHHLPNQLFSVCLDYSRGPRTRDTSKRYIPLKCVCCVGRMELYIEHIRDSFGVTPITEKLSESRLRWYEHIMRRPDDRVVATQKRGRGRQQTLWITNYLRDMKCLGLLTTLVSEVDGASRLGKPTP